MDFAFVARAAGPATRHAGFRRLITGQVGLAFGAQIGGLAIPTIAIIDLHADPVEVGILGALPWRPAPVLGLLIGVLVDRLPRRPLMIAAESGRWLVLASLALLVGAGSVTLYHLYVTALLLGLLGTLYDIAYQSFLPSTLDDGELLRANSVVDVVKTPALVTGPAVGGALIAGIGAGAAVLVYCAGSLASLVSVLSIGASEGGNAGRRGGWLPELLTGVKLVAGTPLLRAVATAATVSNLGTFMFSSVSLVFAYRYLHLSPVLVGSILAVGNLGYLGGAAGAPLWVKELGLGRTLALAQVFLALSLFTAPLSLVTMSYAVFAASQLLQNLTSEVFNLNQVSLRQAITPRPLLGRMNATMRTGIVGIIPLGMVLGGYLGTTLGVVETMLIGAAIALMAPLFILSGPLVRVRGFEEALAPR